MLGGGLGCFCHWGGFWGLELGILEDWWWEGVEKVCESWDAFLEHLEDVIICDVDILDSDWKLLQVSDCPNLQGPVWRILELCKKLLDRANHVPGLQKHSAIP